MSSILNTNCDDFPGLSALLVRDSNPLISNLPSALNGSALLPNGSASLSMSMSSNQLKEERDRNPMSFQLESSLLSQERLDRSSPDLWPEQIPGVTEFLARSTSPLLGGTGPGGNGVMGGAGEPPEWLTDFDEDDINMLHGFGSLTTIALLEKVKELQDLAYQLGLEESREMTRGKFLNVLSEGQRQLPGGASIRTRHNFM